MESLIIEKETKKMNLWIRTQDRKKLVLINTLAIADDDSGSILGFGIDGRVKVNLGDYKTEERSLEILDDIQNLLNSVHTIFLNQNEKIVGANILYEMPEK